MGKHAEWRKLVKKLRRKRIRQRFAKSRDYAEEEAQRRREASPTYQRWLMHQEHEEQFQAEEEARLAAQRETDWLRVEAESQRQWRELQKKLEEIREERQRQNERIKLEWEKEQKKLQELKEQKERETEVKRLEEQRLAEELENFIANGGSTPEHLKTNLESNPGKPLCAFFKKTSACRFRDSCSRNHVRPGVSRVLLIPNFYSNYSLEQTENEHGNDMGLEFDNEDLYRDFKEFFYDVVSELENCGEIVHFNVCCNHEQHLRGNVYVEFSQTREAIKCYRALNGRFYAGKQLSVQFCKIRNWRLAICSEFYRKTCPKGNFCNFLHVFRNPDRLYPQDNRQAKYVTKEIHDSPSQSRNWRWSESPERDIYREKVPDDWETRDSRSNESGRCKRQYSSEYKNGSSYTTSSRSRHRSPRRSRHRSRSSEQRKHRSRSRSRSRSPRYSRRRSRRYSPEIP